MTTEPMGEADAPEGESLRCYRHPDRVTYVRCGRCDRPICPRCAMQGPVGFRCKTCGKPAFDPLTSFTPIQLALGAGVSLAGGTVGGLIGLQVGFFSIRVGFFAGGLIADAVMRVTGYKRGLVMGLVLAGGIVAGTLLAAVVDYAVLYTGYYGAGTYPLSTYLANVLVWGGVYAGAAIAGAMGRLRF